MISSEPTPSVITIKESIRNGVSSEKSSNLSSVHLLPCTIPCSCSGNRDGPYCSHPAKVDEYFDPIIIRNGEEQPKGDASLDGGDYNATFRGRPLKGVSLQLPRGYGGKILCESQNNISMEEEVLHTIIDVMCLGGVVHKISKFFCIFLCKSPSCEATVW